MSVAVLCVVAEIVFATISNVLLRVVSTDLAPEWTLFLRLVLTSAILVPFLVNSGPSREATREVLSNKRRLGRYVSCGLVSYAASIAWLYALLKLPIAMATSLFFSTALLMGVMARIWLNDAFTARNWIALGVGLIGVMIVLRPSLTGVHADGVVAALVAAALAALGKLQLKTLSGREQPALSAFLRLAPVIPFAGIAMFGAWSWPHPHAWVAIVSASVLLAVGHAAIAKGYASFSLSQAAVLEYLRLLFATIAGIVVFAEPIGMSTLLGGAVILSATLLGAQRRIPVPALREAR